MSGLRSAARYHLENTSEKLGFRVARTLVRKPFRPPPSDPRFSQIEIDVGPPACPAELNTFAGEEFEPLVDQQIIQLGNWNVSNVPTRRFRVRNPTDATIELPHLPWMSNQFEFDPAPPLKIEAKSPVEFGLRMALVGVGDRFHDLDFRWGKLVDADKNEFEFPAVRVHGCFEGPLLEVMGVGRFGSTPQELDMGTIPVGANLGKVLYVINVGDRSTEAEVTDVTAPFFVESPLGGSIVPNTIDARFRIGLDASAIGEFNGQVTVRSKQQPPLEFHGQFADRVALGCPDDDTIIGDWNGDSIDDLAVSRPGTIVAPGRRIWQLTWNGLAVPRELINLSPLDVPLAGDWDGDGDDEPAGWRPVARPGPSYWQFESDGDSHSNSDLIGFGFETDLPVTLRHRKKPSSPE